MTAKWTIEDAAGPLALSEEDVNVLLDNGYTIKDGDTLVTPEGEVVRLQGLNSPETAKPWKDKPTGDAIGGQLSKNAAEYAVGTGVTGIDRMGTDVHGRTVGRVETGLGDLNRFQIANHYARASQFRGGSADLNEMQRVANMDRVLNPDHPVLKHLEQFNGMYADVPLRSASQLRHRQGWVDRALDRSVDSAQQGLYGLAHMVARGVGSKEGQKWAEEGILRQDEEMRYQPAEVPSYTDIDSMRDAGRYVGEKVIENVTMLGMGGVGGLAARVVGRGAAKQAGKQAMLRARAHVPAALRAERIKAAQPALSPSRAAEVTRQKLWEAGKSKSDDVLNKYTKAGATAGFYPANVGETEISQMNLDDPASPLIVAAAGAVKSALDVVGVERALTSFFGAKQATNIQEMAKEVIKAAGVSGAAESVTETMQTAVDIILRGIQDPSFDPLGPESIQSLKEAAVAGFATGGVLGAVSGGAGALGGPQGPGNAPLKGAIDPPPPAPGGGGEPDLAFRHTVLEGMSADIAGSNSAGAKQGYDMLVEHDPKFKKELDKWFEVVGDTVKWKGDEKVSRALYKEYLVKAGVILETSAKQPEATEDITSQEFDEAQSLTDPVENPAENPADGHEAQSLTGPVENPADGHDHGADFQHPWEQPGESEEPGNMGKKAPNFGSEAEDNADNQMAEQLRQEQTEAEGLDSQASEDERKKQRTRDSIKIADYVRLGKESAKIHEKFRRELKGIGDEARLKEILSKKQRTLKNARALTKTVESPEVEAARKEYEATLEKNVKDEIKSLYGVMGKQSIDTLKGGGDDKDKDTGDYSKTVKKLQDVVDKWFKGMGKSAPIIKSTPETGVAQWTTGTKAGTITLSADRLRTLQSKDSTPKERAQAMDVVAHEVGHALSKVLGLRLQHFMHDSKMDGKPSSDRGYTDDELTALKGDFDTWKKDVNETRDFTSRRSPIGRSNPEAGLLKGGDTELMDEWFADQVSHYLLTGKHGLDLSSASKGVIKRIADSVKEFYTKLMKELGVADKEVAPSVVAVIERQFTKAKAKPEVKKAKVKKAKVKVKSKAKQSGEYPPATTGHNSITTIISGGQTGGDIAGIRAGQQLKREGWGVELGGMVPKGYVAENGGIDKADRPIFTEDGSSAYPPRTKKNVQNADATIAFTRKGSIGTGKTIKMAKEQGKPHHVVDLKELVVAYKKDNNSEFISVDEKAKQRGEPYLKVNLYKLVKLYEQKGEEHIAGFAKFISVDEKAKQRGEPYLKVNFEKLVEFYEQKGWGEHVAGFAEFLATNENVHSLNIAGIRGSHANTVGAANRVELEKIIQEFLVEGIKQGEKKPSKTTSKGKVKATTGKSQSYVDAVDRAVNFLNHYGFEVSYAEQLLVNLAHKEIDADLSDPVQLAKALAEPLSTMMSRSNEFTKVRLAISESDIFKNDVAALLEGNTDDNTKRATDKAERTVTKEVFQRLLEEGISDKLASDYNLNATLKAKILKFLEDVAKFLSSFAESKEWKNVKKEIQGIVNRTFEGNDFNFIRATNRPDFRQVNLQEAFDGNKLAHKIMSRIGTDSRVILTGSIAYAPQGPMYRRKGAEVHDLDFIFDGPVDESKALIKQEFEESRRAYNFTEGGKTTWTYMVPPEGHTVGDVKRLKKGDDGSKVMGFTVYKGEEPVGTYSVDPADYSETKTGVEAVFVDFFHDIPDPQTIDFEFKTDEGKAENVRLSHFGRGFDAKLAFGRLKDIWDYNRFMPDRGEVADGPVEADILDATQTQEHQGQGYDEDGNPISGDTHSQQADPRLVTFRVQGKGSDTNWERFREGEPILLKRAGFKSITANKTLIDQAITIAKVAYGTDDLIFIRKDRNVIGEYIDITESVETGTLGSNDSRPIMILPKTPLGDAPRYVYKGENKARTMADRFATMRYNQFMELSQQVTIEKAMNSATESTWVVAHRNDTRDAEINAARILQRFELMKEAGRDYRKNRVMLDRVVNGKRTASVAFDGYKIMRLGLDLNGMTGAVSISDKKEGILTGLTLLRATDVGGRNEHVVYELPISYRDEAPDPAKLRTERVEFIDQWVKVDGIALPSLGSNSRPVAQLTVEEEAKLLIQLAAVDMSNTQNLVKTGGKEKRLVEGKKKKVRAPKRLVTAPASGIATSDTEWADNHLARAEALTQVKDLIKLLVNKSPKNKDAEKARKKLLSLANKEGDLTEAVRKYLGVGKRRNEYTDLAVSKFVTALETGKTEDAIKGVVMPYWLPRLIAREASKARARGKLILKGIDLDGPFSEAEELAIELLEDQIERTNDAWEVKELEDKLSLFMMHREKADYETIIEGGSSNAEVDPRMTSVNPPLEKVEHDPTVQRVAKHGVDAENANITKKTLKALSKTHSYTTDKRAVKLIDTWKKLLGIKTQVIVADMKGVQRYIEELKKEKARLNKLKEGVTKSEISEFDDAIKQLSGIVIDGAQNSGISSSRVLYMDKYKHSKLRVPVIYVPSVKAVNKAKIAEHKELEAQAKLVASQIGELEGEKADAARVVLDKLERSLEKLRESSVDVDIVTALAHEFGHLVQRTSLDQLVERKDKESQEIREEIFGDVNWADKDEATAARERFADMFIHWVDGRPEASDAVTKFFKGILDKLKALVQSLKAIITTVGERSRKEWREELSQLEVRRDDIIKQSFGDDKFRAVKKKRAANRSRLERIIKRHGEDIGALHNIMSYVWQMGLDNDTVIGIRNPERTTTFAKLSPDYIPVKDIKGRKRVILDPRWWEDTAIGNIGTKGEYPGASVYEWLEKGKALESSTKVSKGKPRSVQGYSVNEVAERLTAELDARDRAKGQLGLITHEDAMLEAELKGVRERIKELKAQLKLKPKSVDHQPSVNAFLDAMVDRHIVAHPDKYVEAARSLSTSTTMLHKAAGVNSVHEDFFIGERVVSSARDSRVGKATIETTKALVDKLGALDPLYKSVDRVLRAMGSTAATDIARNFRVQSGEKGKPTIPEIIKGYQQRLYLDMRVKQGDSFVKVGMIKTLSQIPSMPTWIEKRRNPKKAAFAEAKLKDLSRHLIQHTPISEVPMNVRSEVKAVRTYFKAIYARYGQDLRMEGTKDYFPLVLDTQGKWVAEGAKEKIIKIFMEEDKLVHDSPLMSEVEAEQLWQEIASHDGQVDPNVDIDAFVTSSFRAKYKRVFTPRLSKQLAEYYVDDISTLTIGYTDALAKRLAWQREYGGYAFDAYGRPILEMGVGGPTDLRHKWHPTAKLEFKLNYAVRSVTDSLTVNQANWIRYKALEAYKGSLGANMNPTVRKVQGGVITGLNTSLLSGASLTSLPDLAGIYIRLGETDGFKRSWKGLQDTIRYLKDPKYAEEAKSYAGMLLSIYDGMVDHTLASAMEIGYMPTGLKRINDKFFRAIGLKRWTDFTRIAAVQVAKDDIKYLAKQNDAKSTEKLARLGLTRELVQEWIDGGLDRNTLDPSRVGEISIEIRTAINRWVDEAVMRPTAQTRPYYGSDHRMALFFYLRGFMWSFYETIWHQTMVNMGDAKGVAKVLPLMALGATVMPLAALGYELRKLLFGKLPAEALNLEDTTRDYQGLDYLSEVARRSGLYGPLQLIDDAATDMDRGNRALANFMGVPFGILVKMLDKPEDIWKFTPVLNQSSTLKAAIGD